MSTGIAWIDGRWSDLASAHVPVIDLGLLRGMALFETLRTRWHPNSDIPQPHTLESHFERLRGGAVHYNIPMPWPDLTQLRDLIEEGIRQAPFCQASSSHPGARINIIMTPGDLTAGMFGSDAPRGILLFTPLSLPDDRLLNDGIKVITHPALRVDPHFKTTCYLMGRPALLAAQQAGAAEALYVDGAGLISEGVTSNCGIISNGAIVLPNAAALAGITLTEIQTLADERGISISRAPLRRDDFQRANEAFICSSVRGILPVVAIDDQTVGNGSVGPIVHDLARAHRALPAAP